jgi:lysophospholipase L1-like esterase
MLRPFPENTAVWNLVDITLWNILNRSPKEIVLELPDARAYTTRQANYLAAPLISELPNLEPALKQYRANLLHLVTLAKSQSIRLIFATQPAVWHDNLSPEMAKFLWFGFRGNFEAPNGHYEIMDLRAGLDQFNQTLLNVCQEEGVECVDLAAEMNGREDYFYDDVHFNKAGGAKVAELLALHFRQQQTQND